VGLTPVAWIMGVVAEYAVGGGGEPGYPWYSQIPFFVLWLAPGTAALVLAFLAGRADKDAAKAVFVVSAGLSTFSVWVWVGGNTSVYTGIAAAAGCGALILIAVFAWPGLTKPPSEA
jgi:hypothetical protein